MFSRNKIWFGVIGLLATTAFTGWFAYNGGTYTIQLTQQEVQQRVDEALTSLNQKTSLKIEVIQVWFENSKIRFNAKISGMTRGRAVRADIRGVGIPEYQNGSFYFHPVEPIHFSNVKMERMGETEKKQKPFSKTEVLLRKKINVFITKYGWEEIAETFKSEFREWSILVAEKQITRTFSRYPLYTLKDAKGWVVRVVLEKIEMAGDKLNVTFSLIQFGYTIIFAIFLLSVVVCIVIFMSF